MEPRDINTKIGDINSSVFVISLSINGPNLPIKRQRISDCFKNRVHTEPYVVYVIS